MKYIKKAVIIDALQWDGKNLDDCICFLGDDFKGHNQERHPNGKNEIVIATLEGQHIASEGDFIIRGVKGEHYPCKPDIFKMTYDKID